MRTIAVIGAGISGLAAAYLLSRRHRVSLFEKERRLGGHTNTVLHPHSLLRQSRAALARCATDVEVVGGGSHTYIPRLVAPVSGGVHEGAAIVAVRRREDGVTIAFRNRPSMAFDDVVFACHGDQVLSLLADPSDRERDVFAGFTTTTNVAWLHTDASVLPVRARARASWNYLLAADADAPPMVTYELNRLQGLRTPEQYCVTLNPDSHIDQRRVPGRFVYRHPLYTRAAIGAQQRWREVSGVNRTHYCGAYWFYGFHEDGLNSALRVAGALGVEW